MIALLHRALISDVLDLSKIEAGKMEIETIPFDMREEVDSILSLFEEKVQQKRLEVSALVTIVFRLGYMVTLGGFGRSLSTLLEMPSRYVLVVISKHVTK